MVQQTHFQETQTRSYVHRQFRYLDEDLQKLGGGSRGISDHTAAAVGSPITTTLQMGSTTANQKG